MPVEETVRVEKQEGVQFFLMDCAKRGRFLTDPLSIPKTPSAGKRSRGPRFSGVLDPSQRLDL